MSTYEPGTVAVATVRGVPNVRVMRTEDGWQSPERWVSDSKVADIRTLVVLELSESDRLALIGDLRSFVHTFLSESIADQIEQQTKPPRIPEPGLWGVVEASVGKDGRYRFVRAYPAQWLCVADTSTYRWDDLTDPVLVRDGIEATS